MTDTSVPVLRVQPRVRAPALMHSQDAGLVYNIPLKWKRILIPNPGICATSVRERQGGGSS